MPDIALNDYSRVFLIINRAGPANPPVYQGWWRAGSPSWEQGDSTPVKVPSEDSYGQFKTVGKVSGEPGNPELPLTARFTLDLSTLLDLTRGGCDHDIQVHFGNCRDPRNFNGGWEKVMILEAAKITSWGADELGSLEPSQSAAVNEEATFSGEDLYEIGRITFATKAATQIEQEVVDVEICDTQTCGACGLPSSGCDVVFAISKTMTASPGLSAEIIYSQDGGLTWGNMQIGSLAANEDPNAMACVGTNVIVVSNDSASLHYAPTADILDGTASWTEMATGFVGGGNPNAIASVGSTYTWIVGDGGYIYFADDPTSLVEVQDAGSATSENLLDIDALDADTLVAVGANNAVVYTVNGGVTWTAVIGPAVGVQLNAVKVKTKETWWVGAANGKLYYTRNSGTTWTEKAFPGSGAGVVYDIEFSTDSVGWLAHTTAAPAGRILRTIDGGYSWYVAPEGSTTIPTNTGIKALATCVRPNIVYGGGLVVSGDGILIASA